VAGQRGQRFGSVVLLRGGAADGPLTAEARALEYTPDSAAALAELRVTQRGSAITGPGLYADILAPQPNRDDDRERVGETEVVHRFAGAPGDSKIVRWHYVEVGDPRGETVVLRHGIPESWYVWRHQIDGLAPHRFTGAGRRPHRLRSVG
jgi:hypothetical protein